MFTTILERRALNGCAGFSNFDNRRKPQPRETHLDARAWRDYWCRETCIFAGSQGVRFWRNVTIGLGNANNTFTGDVDLEDATTVRILNANALPSGARTGNINLNPRLPGNYGCTLDLYGTSITVNGLNSSSSTTVLQNTVTSSDGGNVTLTLGDNNQGGNFLGNIVNGSATLSLTKIGTGTQTLAGINSYTGDTTISDRALVLADDGQLAFAIGANGVNNWLTGVGTLTLDGDFSFDLSGADDMTAGNSWNIVDVAGLTETYSATFSVLGFSESSDVWTMTAGNGRLWTFTEASGVLTVVPEPSTLVLGLLGGLGVLVLLRRRSP